MSAVWTAPDVTRGEAIALGLIVAEWSIGDSFCRAYGRTRAEAIANVLAQRDESASLYVTTGRNDHDASGADWLEIPLVAQSRTDRLAPPDGDQHQGAHDEGGNHPLSLRPPTRASHCSCGRPARQVLDGGEWGPTGYCGVPGWPPADPCDCGQGAGRHDRSVCHIYGRGMAGAR